MVTQSIVLKIVLHCQGRCQGLLQVKILYLLVRKVTLENVYVIVFCP